MLTAAEVQKVIGAVLTRASEVGAKISVAVLDDGGYLQGAARTDGAVRLSPDLAISKAYTSAMFGRTTLEIGTDTPSEVLNARRNIGLYPMSGSGGGIPIKSGDVLIGAIGVGGELPDIDIDCAMAGLAVVPPEAFTR
jgi:glc operon protein GlcG